MFPTNVSRAAILAVLLLSSVNGNVAESAAPIRLSGSGKQATRQITLPAGLHVVRMSHQGSSNFIIRPHGIDGTKFSPLVNEIGIFNGSAVFAVEKEQAYLFSINADGNWSLSIESPKKSTNASTIRGRGQQATNLVSLKGGLYVFEMKHTGRSNFIVRPYSLSGAKYSAIANEIGNFNGSTIETLDPGDYVFDIHADGDWELTIKRQ